MDQDHSYARLHTLSGPVLHFDLEEKAQAILEAARLATTGRAAETLVKEGQLRLTIIGFTAGSFISEHRVSGPVSIEVLDGLVTVTTGRESNDVRRGKLLVLEAGCITPCLPSLTPCCSFPSL